MCKRKSEMMGAALLDAEVKELRKENCELKQYILALQGEVYGARLAAKYLDKELAGRSVRQLLSFIFYLEGLYDLLA